MSRRKNTILITLLAIAIAVAFFVIRYFTQTRMVPLSVKNISSLSLVDASKKKASGKSYAANTKAVRVWDGKTYTLSYVGSDGYATSSVSITPKTESVTIDPDYSDAKNSNLLAEAMPDIIAAIHGAAPTVDQYYTISRGNLMKHGAWYFTNLVYKGPSDDDSSDTLTTGLQKVGDEWKVALFPSIVFTTSANQGVSKDFIEAANNYRFTTVTPTAESYY